MSRRKKFKSLTNLSRRKSKRSSFDLLSEAFGNFISDGNFIKSDKLSSVSIKATYDRIFTKHYVRKSFIVTHIPTYFEGYLIALIRGEMDNACKTFCETIVTTDHITVKVPVKSRAFISIFNGQERKLDAYTEAIESESRAGLSTGKTYRVNGRSIKISREIYERMQDEFASTTYVSEHTKLRGTFTSTSIYIDCLISLDNSEDKRRINKDRLKSVIDTIDNILDSCGIGYKPIKKRIGLKFESYGMAGLRNKQTPPEKTVLLSEENTSALLPLTTRGSIGGGPILLGQQTESKAPFSLDLFNTGKGRMWILDGPTGCGKTHVGKQLVLSLLNVGVHCGVVDIKGKEYACLGDLNLGFKPLVLQMNKGYFVNTLRIDDMDATEDDCVEIYANAVKGTTLMLKILAEDEKDNIPEKDFYILIDTAVRKLLSTNGVFEDDPDSFINSKGLKYYDVVPIMRELLLSTIFTDDLVRIGNTILSRLISMLGTTYAFDSISQNEITLKTILESELVIYEFNKNEGIMTDVMDAVSVFGVQYLETKKQSYRKRQGKHTASFLEELQRCDSFANMLEYVNHVVTGSRSNNVLVFLLFNSLSILNKPELAPTRSNISNFILGALPKTDRELLGSLFDMEEGIQMIEDMINRGLQHTFYCKYDVGVDKGEVLFSTKYPKRIADILETVDKKPNVSEVD